MTRIGVAVWLALCFHGPLVLAGFYRYSYDAGAHQFFADHYLRSPFALWEPRWFGGFSVSSYPPLAHQLVAAVGRVTGVEIAFGVILLATLLLIPVAVRGFARMFVADGPARAAAIVSVFLPAFALAGHSFGQLPTLLALVVVLFLATEWRRFVDHGGTRTLLIVAALGGLAFSAHHATPVLFLPVALAASFVAAGRALPIVQRALRAVVASVAIAAAGGIAMFPFLLWQRIAPEHITIPHLSRANFLVDADARALFFWGMYGVLPAIALAGIWLARDRRTVVPTVAATLLGVIGLGGTTPLPTLLFGAGWEWLTYDRFALWSAVMLLPLAGTAIHAAISDARRIARVAAAASLAGLGCFAAAESAPLLGALPAQHDLDAVAAFLNEGDSAAWRYQTFGFGDATNRLAHRTSAATIDGAYFTARGVPELQASGIGMLDYALWSDPSGEQLRRALASADRYGIRWALVAESKYEPFVAEAGFVQRGMIADGVAVWENTDAPAVAPAELRFGTPDAVGVMWGTVPAALLAMLGVLLATRRRALARRGRSQWEPSSPPAPVAISSQP
jgi:hypothetical protein